MANKTKQIKTLSDLTRQGRFEVYDMDGDCMDEYDTIEDAKELVQQIVDDNDDDVDGYTYYLVEKKLVGKFEIPKRVAPKVTLTAIK